MRALLLLAAVGSASALESWGLPDLHQQDKQEHFVCGYIIAATTDAIITSHRLDARWSWWQRDLAGIGVSALAGIAKEVRDDHVGRKRGDADPKDAAATVLGGAFYVALSHTWRW